MPATDPALLLLPGWGRLTVWLRTITRAGSMSSANPDARALFAVLARLDLDAARARLAEAAGAPPEEVEAIRRGER
ncbi:hypothetical protein ACWEU6_21920 [Streptosporangium sandarakinum]